MSAETRSSLLLSDCILCYSLCLESAGLCEAETTWFIISVAYSRFLFLFHPLVSLFIMKLCYSTYSISIFLTCVCTQQKAINQMCICSLHNVSGVWGNVGDPMNNTSCSLSDASADNNEAGYHRGSTRRIWVHYCSCGCLVMSPVFTWGIACHWEASRSSAMRLGDASRMPSLPLPQSSRVAFNRHKWSAITTVCNSCSVQ